MKTTTSSSKARGDGPESARKSSPRRTDSRQAVKILILAGGWSKEIPVNEGYNRIDSSKPLNLPQEGPSESSEPSYSKDYTLSRALQNAQLLDDIDALLSPGQVEEKFQAKYSCTEVNPLARFLLEGREEQACIISLKEEAGGLNISCQSSLGNPRAAIVKSFS